MKTVTIHCICFNTNARQLENFMHGNISKCIQQSGPCHITQAVAKTEATPCHSNFYAIPFDHAAILCYKCILCVAILSDMEN